MAVAVAASNLIRLPQRFTCAATSPTVTRTLPPPPTPSPISSSAACALHCPHFNSCSGCTHEYNLHQPPILDEAIDFFNNIGLSDFTFDSCRLWGWRCRAKLAVRGSSIKPLIGLYEEGTHNVVDIPQCKAHHPNINAAVDLLKQGMAKLNIEPYDEDNGTGELRYVQMAVTTYNTSLPASERYKNDGDIFWEHVGGIDVYMAPSSFGQANTRAFNSLLNKLQRYVHHGAHVVDLYAGAGVIGLSLATSRKCRSVKCVEVNKEAKLSFERTASRLPPTLDCSISWHHADISKESLSWIMGSDVVVVDPPRKGLDPSLLDALQSLKFLRNKDNPVDSNNRKVEKRPWILRERETSVHVNPEVKDESRLLPQTLIYISCGWSNFKEDCMSLLSSKAWYLEKAHGFNFFPGTQSIEILAVFKRGSSATITKKKKLGKKKKANQS